MKSSILVALAATSILASLPGPALADGNFYVGGSLGTAALDDRFDGFAVDTDSTAFRLVAGWRFNRYFSLEGGYHNFGEFEQRFVADDTSIRIGLKADGFTLGMTGTLPLGDKFGLYGRTGYFFWDGDAEINNVSQARPEDANLYLGAGAQYSFSERWTLIGDYSSYRLEDTTSTVVALGLVVSF